MTTSSAVLDGRGVVVTGAARGIGRALAARAVREGARVVVNDLDADACRETADALGATAVPGDCASVDGVDALVGAAVAELGRVDVWFANAGVDGAPGAGLGDGASGGVSLETSEEVWAQVHDVNVMAHVRTARALVPRWLEDGGGGRMVVTASAAGLLTMIGSAPYSVTKHAAVAFAEWLSVTYGDRGVTVQTICPQGVATRMLEGSGPLQALLSRDTALEPEDVAQAWVDSLADDRFLVLPHPQVADYYVARATDTDRWLAGMRRLQASALGEP